METITIDGLDEHDFRRSIENMLRQGEADGAARKLRALLEPYAGDDRILPARFLTVSSRELALSGWDKLEERIGEYDRPHQQISAVSVAVTDADVADAASRPAPYIETSYYSDEAYPFSEAARSDLLDGYSLYGCEWQGNFEKTDSTLSIEGLEDLYDAVARLEARLMASDAPSEDEIRAGSLGACYLSVLIHQAVRDSIQSNGLPRAMCVMAGNNGVYPFFDAPVLSSEEYRGETTAQPEIDVPAPAATPVADASPPYESLLSVQTRKAKKKPVLMLDPAEAEIAAHLGEIAAAEHLAEAGTAPRSGTVVTFPAQDKPEPITSEDTAPVAESAAFDQQADPEPVESEEPALVDEPNDETCEEQAVSGWAPVEPSNVDIAQSADAWGDVEPVEVWDEPALHPIDDVAEPAATEIADEIIEPANPPALEIPEPAGAIVAIPPLERPRVSPPEPNANGHRLRARIVGTPQVEKTFGSRLVAALQWLEKWFRKRRS